MIKKQLKVPRTTNGKWVSFARCGADIRLARFDELLLAHHRLRAVQIIDGHPVYENKEFKAMGNIVE